MASNKVANYLEVMGKEEGIGLAARQSIYSGDCIPLGHKGIPSVTFAREIPESIKKQTREYIENSGKQLEESSPKK